MVVKYDKSELERLLKEYSPADVSRIMGMPDNYIYCLMKYYGFSSPHKRVMKPDRLRVPITEIVALIKEHPVFIDELREKYKNRPIYPRSLRRRLKAYGILSFYYPGKGSGIGRRGRTERPRRFLIFYVNGQEPLAWERINNRYDLGNNKWREIGIPLLGRKNAIAYRSRRKQYALGVGPIEMGELLLEGVKE